jgi:hypothetical protein
MYPKIFSLLVFLLPFAFTTQAQFFIDAETGIVFNSTYNKVRVPGNSGTNFDLAKDFSGNNTLFYRLRAGYTISDRHTISVLYAPLSVASSSTPQQVISFNNVSFIAGTKTDARYTFNSYRLTYRYDFIRNTSFRMGAGITAKIRDASIKLSNEQTSATKINQGFVPLINFYATWNITQHWNLILEGDALVAPQGRAEDVFIGAGYELKKDKIIIKGGYRILEGGADNEEVYNFTWFNYASVGAIFKF